MVTIFAPYASALASRWFDDACVVYNEASGDTHLLDALSAMLLLDVTQKPQTDEELRNTLRSACSDAPAKEIDQFLETCLHELSSRELIAISADQQPSITTAS